VLPDSLDPETLRTIAIVALVVLVLFGLLVLRMVQKMVLRVVLLGLLAGLGVFVWAQRDALADCAKTCDCRFAGQDVHVPSCDGLKVQMR
jgi:hypothetical protein